MKILRWVLNYPQARSMLRKLFRMQHSYFLWKRKNISEDITKNSDSRTKSQKHKSRAKRTMNYPAGVSREAARPLVGGASASPSPWPAALTQVQPPPLKVSRQGSLPLVAWPPPLCSWPGVGAAPHFSLPLVTLGPRDALRLLPGI